MEAPGLEAPGLSKSSSTSSLSSASLTFTTLKNSLDACANAFAVKQLMPQIATGSKKMSVKEIEIITNLYDSRYRELEKAPQVKLRVISAADVTADSFVEIERPTSLHNMRKAEMWGQLFNRPDYFEILRTEGMAGQLVEGNCRSVAWKLYLGTLPVAKDKWVEGAAKLRQEYVDIIKKFVLDPHELAKEDDLIKNNPLSIDDDAPWQQHFKDEEYRKNIQQDINRTFPEVEFFRKEEVQEDLLNILFCYGRIHTDLGYKQGMHELLAGIYYTIYLDRADPDDKQTAEFTDVMLNVLDPKYVAHDAYQMFAVVMDVAANWFRQSKSNRGTLQQKVVKSSLFQESNYDDSSSAIMVQLRRIHERILKSYDPELHALFLRLDISPQIYGLRWIRVLFAREFSLKDSFIVWDAIFADSSLLGLTDYIFVAILCFYRSRYLSSDKNTTLKLLMSPLENVTDVTYIVELALHIRQPKIYPRPAVVGGVEEEEEPLPSTISVQPTSPTKTPGNRSPRKGFDTPSRGATSPISITPTSNTNSNNTSNHPYSVVAPYPTSSPANNSIGRPSVSSEVIQPSATQGLLKVNEQLRQKILKLEKNNALFGEKLNTHLTQLQDELLVTDRLPNDDVLYLALAGMKEVKDVMQGRISPTAIFQQHEKLTKK